MLVIISYRRLWRIGPGITVVITGMVSAQVCDPDRGGCRLEIRIMPSIIRLLVIVWIIIITIIIAMIKAIITIISVAITKVRITVVIVITTVRKIVRTVIVIVIITKTPPPAVLNAHSYFTVF